MAKDRRGFSFGLTPLLQQNEWRQFALLRQIASVNQSMSVLAKELAVFTARLNQLDTEISTNLLQKKHIAIEQLEFLHQQKLSFQAIRLKKQTEMQEQRQQHQQLLSDLSDLKKREEKILDIKEEALSEFDQAQAKQQLSQLDEIYLQRRYQRSGL